jgi:hypothetical protein
MSGCQEDNRLFTDRAAKKNNGALTGKAKNIVCFYLDVGVKR